MRNVETKLRSFVGEDEEVRHDGYLRTALCVEWWLERRRKWRHINIVTAVATGRGWQAKRPQCFFSIPLILFARRSFLSLEKGPPFRPSTPVTRENSELETAIPANHRSLALRFYFSTHEDQLRVIKYSFQSKIAPSILSSLFITIPNLDREISHLFMLIPFFFSISPIPIVRNIPARTSWRITDRKRPPLDSVPIVDFGYICTWVVSYVYTSQEQDAIYASGHGALYVGQRRTRARLNQLAGISRLRDWQGLLRSWTRLGNRNETLEREFQKDGFLRDFIDILRCDMMARLGEERVWSMFSKLWGYWNFTLKVLRVKLRKKGRLFLYWRLKNSRVV